ncbi:MAG: Gfo/Idh/MocA family oxidoreductase [Ardenticatenaceae bacterium]|nr:Gfo/Idh/MocA family oxidoreductase [Ardenticatenaceae bacterium]
MNGTGLRWGVLGPGKIARSVAPALATSGRLVAIGSRDEARARAFADRYGAPKAYGSYEALLADVEVEAVYVAVPNSLHAEWSIKAARAGKHVLCEKPLAVSVAEAQDMLVAAQEAGIVLMEGFMYRSHPQMPALKAVVEAGQIGELRLIVSCFSFSVDRSGDVRLSAELAGGSLWDVGCYCVNLARFLAGGEPQTVSAAANFEGGVDTLFAGILQFAGGVVSHFDSGLRVPLRAAAAVVGSEGRVVVPAPWKPDFHRASFTIETAAGQREVVIEEGGNWYERQADAFAAAVRGEAPPPISLADSLENTRTLVALDRAARERRVVALSALEAPATGA